MKTTKDSDLSLLLIFQQSDKLLTRSQSRKKKKSFSNHIPDTATGEPFRTERGAINLLYIELYFTVFKFTYVNTELVSLGQFTLSIVEYSM